MNVPCSIRKKAGQQTVQEVFHIESKYILVDGIPATVCMRRGEETLSCKTTEKVWQLVRGEAKPVRSMPLEVFEFA